MAGMVLGIHFTDPGHVALVDNIKFKTEVIKYVENHSKEFKKDNPSVDLAKIIKTWQNLRRTPPYPCVPREIWHWIKPRWQRERIDPKHDHYGVPAGKIDQYWIDQFPKDFFDYALAAEWVEETETNIYKEVETAGKMARVPLFQRLTLLISKNRESGIFDYEHYFFHVLEKTGEWGTKGFPGETEAPEIIPIKNLYPPDFRDSSGQWPEGGIDLYPKHGFGVKLCLRELVNNNKKEEYRESLSHIEKFFPREAESVGLVKEIEKEPTLNLNDNELFELYMRGVKKI